MRGRERPSGGHRPLHKRGNRGSEVQRLSEVIHTWDLIPDPNISLELSRNDSNSAFAGRAWAQISLWWLPAGKDYLTQDLQ